MDILTIAEGVCAVITAVSAICALTPTPDPKTPIGKLYRVVEILGLLVGRAKEGGLVPASPAIDKAESAAVDVVKAMLCKGAALLLVAAGLGLAACSSGASLAAQIQPALFPACDAAMALAPAAGPIAPWIIAGCGTAEAIDKLALDPTSTVWVEKLIGQAQAVAGGHA